MGYKTSRANFEKNHLEWCNEDYWTSIRKSDDLFRIYGQAKLDCLLADMKYKEEIGTNGFHLHETEYHILTELSQRTERVSGIIDVIVTQIIHW